MRGLRLLPFCLFAALSAKAQQGSTEQACDTVVYGVRYNRCVLDEHGRYQEFGNRNEAEERHGWWCVLRKDSASSKLTEYHHDLKVHERWKRGCLWRIDEKGNIISKGKADRRARIIF